MDLSKGFLRKFFSLPPPLIRDVYSNDVLSTDDEDEYSAHCRRNNSTNSDRLGIKQLRRLTKAEKQVEIAIIKEHIREILEFLNNSTSAESKNDVLGLNIGGVHYDIERKALLKTPFSYGSNTNTLFSAFFSERWEFYHIQDNNRRIYLDFSDEWFHPILSYIMNYHSPLSSGSSASPVFNSRGSLVIKRKNIGCLELLKFFELDSFFLPSVRSELSLKGLNRSLIGKEYQLIEALKTFYRKYHNLKNKMNVTDHDVDTVVFSPVLSLVVSSRGSSVSSSTTYSTRVLTNPSFSFQSLLSSSSVDSSSSAYDFCLFFRLSYGYYCLFFDSQFFLNLTPEKREETKENNLFSFSDFPQSLSSFSSSSPSASFPSFFFPLQEYNFFPHNMKGNVYLDISYCQLLAIQQHLSFSGSSATDPVIAERDLLSCFFPFRVLRRPPIEEQTSSSLFSPFSSNSSASAYPSSFSSPFVNLPSSSSSSYFASSDPRSSFSSYHEVDSNNFIFEILSSGQLHYLNGLQQTQSIYLQQLELFTMKGTASKNLVLQQKCVIPDPFLPSEFPSSTSLSSELSSSSFAPPLHPPSPPGFTPSASTVHPLCLPSSSSSALSASAKPFVSTTIPFQSLEFLQRKQGRHSNRSKKMECLVEIQKELDQRARLQQMSDPFDDTVLEEKDEYDGQLLVLKQYYYSLIHEIEFMLKYFSEIWNIDDDGDNRKFENEETKRGSHEKKYSAGLFSDNSVCLKLKKKLINLQNKITAIRDQSISIFSSTLSAPVVLSSAIKQQISMTCGPRKENIEENYTKLTEIINENFIDFHHQRISNTEIVSEREKDPEGRKHQSQDLGMPIMVTSDTSTLLRMYPPLFHLICDGDAEDSASGRSPISFSVPVLRSTTLRFIPNSQLGLELKRLETYLSLSSSQNNSQTFSLNLNLFLSSFSIMNNQILKDVIFIFINYLRLQQLLSFNVSFRCDDKEGKRTNESENVPVCSLNKKVKIQKSASVSSKSSLQSCSFPIIVPSHEHYEPFLLLMSSLGVDTSSIRVVVSC
jgi:hypothetical protein